MTDVSIRIQRAVFGDVGGSHNLIVSSEGAPAADLSELAAHTDRLLPTEVAWAPYLCGFPYRSHYVVTRTFPVKASRAGMVQTHVLLVPLEACSCYPRLDDITRLLPESPDSTLDRASSLSSAQLSGTPAVRERASAPVWLGQEGFEQIVIFLWQQLWPHARRDLRFRVSAEPSDLDAFPATIVCSPISQRVHWPPRFLVDQTLGEPKEVSLGEAYLLGLPEGARVGDTRDRIEMVGCTIAGIKRVEQYIRFLEVDTADSVRAAVRLLGAIAPDPAQAIVEKQVVVARLAQKTAAGTEDDVLGLRNFSMTPFTTAPREVREALASWLATRLVAGSGGVSFAREVFVRTNPWQDVASRSFQDAFHPWRTECSKLLWNWWVEEPTLVEPLSSLLPQDDNTRDTHVEDDFVSTAPASIGASAREPILVLARDRQWKRLHATVLAAASDLRPVEKARAYIHWDTDPTSSGGLELLADRIGSDELVAAALDLGDPRLVRLAAAATIASPTLFSAFDPGMPNWCSIWLHRVESGVPLFSAISDPKAVAQRLMEEHLAGRGGIGPLIERVAVDRQAVLAIYPRREELLATLPNAVAKEARGIAAEDWFARFTTDQAFDASALDPEFAAAVVGYWREHRGRLPSDAVSAFFARFSDTVNEADFVAWLDLVPLGVTIVAATALGRFVGRRRWSGAAGRLVGLALGNRNDLVVAAQECLDLVSFWQKGKFALFKGAVTFDEENWWSVWQQLSAKLYPHGVEHWDIWDRADGDVSRVRGDTGWERWSSGMRILRNGGAGRHMTIEGLLHQMRKDFPGNEELYIVEALYLKYGGARSARRSY